MRLFSYVVKHDTGFSPNPFWGYCTLADCKPTIRRTAQKEDWIVGISPKAKGNRIVYAMKVDEVLPYQDYFCDERFGKKIPNYSKGKVVYKCGDNIYEPLSDGGFRQRKSMHSDGGKENPNSKKRDLGGNNVLVAKTFYYFGRDGIKLPTKLNELKVGRGHKCRFPEKIVSAFVEFIQKQAPGIKASPTKWPQGDESWRIG